MVRYQVYSLLAEGITSPSPEWVERWNTKQIRSCLQDLFEQIGFSEGSLQLQNMPEELQFEGLRELYGASFITPGPNKLTIVESIYKTWTELPGSSLTISKSKGFLMGDPALHLSFLLDSLQIEVPEGYETMPDHLVLELELASLLSQTNNPQFKQEFLNDHLDWTELLVADAREKGLDGFYLQWLELIDAFVAWDRMLQVAR